MKSLHLLYHELRPGGSRYSYVMPCEAFEEQCAFYAQIRKSRPEGTLCPEITFDDGNASDVEYAFPILETFRLKATFFITAGWTNTRSGFMNWPQLRTLAVAGHQIGAHGMTHKLLTACSDLELAIELRGAKDRLEDGLGTAVQSMSLPGGRANARVLRACRQAGYRRIFTSAPSAVDLAEDPEIIGRLNLHSTTKLPWLEDLLRPGSGVLAGLQRTDRLKSAAKTILGDTVYRRLWAFANREESQADLGAPAE